MMMRTTKLVITIKNLTYKDRLKRLKLPTVKYRRIRGDMIEVYKILTNKYDSRVNLYLEKQQDSITVAIKPNYCRTPLKVDCSEGHPLRRIDSPSSIKRPYH